LNLEESKILSCIINYNFLYDNKYIKFSTHSCNLLSLNKFVIFVFNDRDQVPIFSEEFENLISIFLEEILDY